MPPRGEISQVAELDPSWPFGRMLEWHVEEWGTRPSGSPNVRGKPWLLKVFAAEVGRTVRTLQLWFDEESFPRDLEAINAALFGANPEYALWRAWLEQSLERSRARASQRKPPPPLTSRERFAIGLSFGVLPVFIWARNTASTLGWEPSSGHYWVLMTTAVCFLLVGLLWFATRKPLSPVERTALLTTSGLLLTGTVTALAELRGMPDGPPLIVAAILLIATVVLPLRAGRSFRDGEIIVIALHFIVQSLFVSLNVAALLGSTPAFGASALFYALTVIVALSWAWQWKRLSPALAVAHFLYMVFSAVFAIALTAPSNSLLAVLLIAATPASFAIHSFFKKRAGKVALSQ